ncbi:MAG TPA: class I SAM-dependent methyltransferase [Chloroflexi bacterium]|jgi:glycine/sarcosine N-methyltransferase|nr:class I SAM-dependent methyltransferase [Chloroflexota bacterium]
MTARNDDRPADVGLYDDFSQDYDRFVDWDARLAFELPFFRSLFSEHGVRRVLDVACGTGQHAIALAREGFEVTATDLSQAMVERARANAAEAGVEVAFSRLGFGELADALDERYNAVICLGNSLPHLLTADEMRYALRDMAAVLRPGGLLVVQNRNFDRVLDTEQRFMPPEAHAQDGDEWVFMRFYDFEPDGLRFNVVRLHRPRGEGWQVRLGHTRLYPWRYAELRELLDEAGLDLVAAHGNYRGEPFDAAESGDLVLVARAR